MFNIRDSLKKLGKSEASFSEVMLLVKDLDQNIVFFQSRDIDVYMNIIETDVKHDYAMFIKGSCCYSLNDFHIIIENLVTKEVSFCVFKIHKNTLSRDEYRMFYDNHYLDYVNVKKTLTTPIDAAVEPQVINGNPFLDADQNLRKIMQTDKTSLNRIVDLKIR